jgi:hypothetical protein
MVPHVDAKTEIRVDRSPASENRRSNNLKRAEHAIARMGGE